MKKIVWLLTFCILLINIGCDELFEDDKLPPMQGFSASQGDYIGVIRLKAEQVEGAEAYNFERKNPETGNWEDVHWGGSYYLDDNGWGLPNNMLVPGKSYEYRARAHRNNGGYNEWGEIVSGYSFAPSPELVSVEYSKPNEYGECSVTVTIKDEHLKNINNLLNISYVVYRSDNITTLEHSNPLTVTTKYKDEFDTSFELFEHYTKLVSGVNYFYKLKSSYNFELMPFFDNTLHHQTDGMYVLESEIYNFESTNPDNNGDDQQSDLATYSVFNYGEINSSFTGGKGYSILQNDGSTVYLGYFDNFNSLLNQGQPVIMNNMNGIWSQLQGNMPSELISGEIIVEYDFDVASGVVCLATLTEDTLYVYKNDGNWSENLTQPILLEGAKAGLLNSFTAKHLNVAYFNNEIYLTIKLDDVIKVFKYANDNWEQVGDDIAIGFNVNTKLKTFDNKLYIWYEQSGDFANMTTLYVKHLEGSSWVNDLEWSIDETTTFNVTISNGTIYFTEGYGKGGVYKATSQYNATNIFADAPELYATPNSITCDQSGNVVVSCIKSAVEVENINNVLLLYDGSEWKEIDDDFSDASFHGSASEVLAVGNDIYFVYGIKSSENINYIPTILKVKKYSK